jgi:hypothetical protein
MPNANAALPELADWQVYQRDFTQFIRDPKHAKKPHKASAQRMRLYAELLFNNVEGAVSACFPVLSKLIGVRKWRRLIREFYATHPCQTPHFRQLPDEFMQFLQSEWTTQPDYPAFTLELAHYEWIELVLMVSNQDELMPPCDAHGDLMTHIPLLNPVMANLSYRYPVHKLSQRYRPVTPPDTPTHLLVYRNQDDEVRFNVQNAVTARLIDILSAHQLTGMQALSQLANEIQHPDLDSLLQFGAALLTDLHQQSCILGVCKH